MRTALVVLVLILAAGCGGGGGESKSAGAKSDGMTADDLAAKIGCPAGDDSDAAANKVSCGANDTYYGITVYKSASTRDADLTAPHPAVLVGDFWIIDAPSAADLETAQGAVGGKIKQ